MTLILTLSISGSGGNLLLASLQFRIIWYGVIFFWGGETTLAVLETFCPIIVLMFLLLSFKLLLEVFKLKVRMSEHQTF